MVGLSHRVAVLLQDLDAHAMLGPEAEIVRLVMPGLVGKPVGIVLVAGEAGPTALSHGVEFRNQKPPHAAMLLLAQDVLDLAVCLGLVGAVLHDVEIVGAHCEGLQHLVVLRTRDEDLGLVRDAADARCGARGHVDPFRLAVPDVDPSCPDAGRRKRPDFHIDGPRGRYDAGLVAGNIVCVRFAPLQLDDVEIVERHNIVLGGDDGFVSVVVGWDVH